MNRTFLIVLFFFSTLVFSTSLHAQGVPVTGGGIDLTASTDNPVPGQKVTITARSYSIEINSAEITWVVDGKTVQKGPGLTSLTISAPALGKKVNITVSALTTTGLKISNSISINSSSVDMIIESDGYVPPFFQGKLPVSYQNTFRIIAVPHLANSKGVEYDPKTLVYQWQKNSKVVEDQSGYGKQTLTVVGDIVPRDLSISVKVSTKDGEMQGLGYASVSYASPSLSFYEDNSLYGPFFNSAIKEFLYINTEKEASVLAIPYGFNKPLLGIGDLALTWMINGFEHPELASNESVTLRVPDGTKGSSNVELSIQNTKQILQNISNSFSVKFSSK